MKHPFSERTSCRIVFAIVNVVLIGAILLLLVTPIAAGPFSAVNGPATALRGSRNARVILAILVLHARAILTRVRAPAVFILKVFRTLLCEIPPSPTTSLIALRC